MSASQLVIGYWSIKGLAAPLRMMCMYSETPFESRTCDLVYDESGMNGAAWFDVKPSLKTKSALINLPYLIDGDRVISQSNACFAYLGRKTGLWGRDDVEVSCCEQLLCEIMDLRNSMTQFAYGGSGAVPEVAVKLVENVTSKNGIFQKLELWLTQQGASFSAETPFLVGGHATAPDFHLFEMIEQYSALAAFHSLPPLLEQYPNLQIFYTSFKGLPQMGRYLASPLYTKLPFNNKSAGFGSTVELTPFVPGQTHEYASTDGSY